MLRGAVPTQGHHHAVPSARTLAPPLTPTPRLLGAPYGAAECQGNHWVHKLDPVTSWCMTQPFQTSVFIIYKMGTKECVLRLS